MPEARTLESSSSDDKRWTKHLRMFLAAHDVNELSAAATAFQEETSNDGAKFSGLMGWFKARWYLRAQECTRRMLERLRVSEHEDLVEAEQQGKTAARMFRRLGRHTEAQSLQLAVLNTRVRVGQSYRQADPSYHGAIMASALEACRESAFIAHQMGDAFSEAEYLTRFGNGLYSAKRFKEAQTEFQKALDIWRRLVPNASGDLRFRLVRGLRHLADSYKQDFQNAKAISLYEEAMALGEQLSADPRELAFCFFNRGTLHQSQGNAVDAGRCLSRCCELLKDAIEKGFTRGTEDPHSPVLAPY